MASSNTTVRQMTSDQNVSDENDQNVSAKKRNSAH